MLELLQNEVVAYVNDDTLTSDAADAFPSRTRLSGKYYVGDEHYWSENDRAYRISIVARCLEKPLFAEQEDLDYLALEVWLHCEPERWIFSSYRNTDSSVI